MPDTAQPLSAEQDCKHLVGTLELLQGIAVKSRDSMHASGWRRHGSDTRLKDALGADTKSGQPSAIATKFRSC